MAGVCVRLGAAGRQGVVCVATVQYYIALMGRSHRWLPPALLYGGALVIQAGGGDYLADSFGYSAVLLLPAVAWLTRALLTAEPPQIRDITASAHGPVSARLSALVAAAGYGFLFAAIGALTAFITATGSPPTAARAATTGTALTAVEGIAAEILCVLLGTAAAAIAAPPLVPAAGWSVLGTATIALGLIVAPFSPANMVIRYLFSAAGTSSSPSLLIAYPSGIALVAVAWFVAGQVAARR